MLCYLSLCFYVIRKKLTQVIQNVISFFKTDELEQVHVIIKAQIYALI